ncbi:DUF4221 domain-containing protein [Aquiflexum gelatinilyticum]|uniref:DUF4221 domain-containing protein n=1 Tax=Aquiflexum gelatinilyticum TaxID=2961943 RepID=UPI002167230C|nr:DUF4221 domain-containing protein [Aquiflexum gelatinilyticum]MCS4433732.1 DUF4221 domain-containing protein [Aquiflexum gelatinilyticum]
MKFLFFTVSVFILFSCGAKKQEKSTEDFSNITFSIDTVMIDSKEQILYLEEDLIRSDYCLQDGFLYNFNGFDHSIEKIDLDRLELVEKFPLEKEGPNGTGFYIFGLTGIGGGKLFLTSETGGSIFSLEGKLLRKYDWSKVTPANGGIAEDEYLQQHIMNPNFDEFVFALAMDQVLNKVSLKKLSADEKLISNYRIDPNENFKKFTLGDLTTFNKWIPRVFIGSQHDRIIVSHEFSNDFYVYSPETDLLQTVSYFPSLTPNMVTVAAEGDLINSIDDRILALESYLGQVSFGQLVWDTQTRKYYRLSFSSKFNDKKREKRLLHETVNVKVFLTVFDEQFNFIYEFEIPDLKILSPSKYFAKDGKLWVYQNFSDELGFVRIGIN